MTTEQSQETKIAILEAKVEHMMNHVTELTKRVRAVEKTCAIVSAIGIGGAGIVGTNIFNPPRAEAHMGHSFPTGEWINDIRQWELEKERTPIDEMLNNALGDFYLEDPDGSNDPTKSEELLQLPSNRD